MLKQIAAVAIGTTLGYVACMAISLIAVKPLTKITMARTMEALS